MLLLWAQKIDLVIIYVPPDNICRPDGSEAKKAEPTHPNPHHKGALKKFIC